MMGRSHLIAGTALGVGALALLHGLASLEGASALQGEIYSGAASTALQGVGDGARWLQGWLLPAEPGWRSWAYAALAAALFWLGSLLPDVDTKSSTLGRLVPWFPGPHHGITHTDWFLAALLAASLPGPTRVLAFLWLGAAIHCELDGWGTAGRVRLWPLGRFRLITYRDGETCVVRPNPRRLHYSSGGPGEAVALGVSVALGAAMFGAGLLLSPFWPIG